MSSDDTKGIVNISNVQDSITDDTRDNVNGALAVFRLEPNEHQVEDEAVLPLSGDTYTSPTTESNVNIKEKTKTQRMLKCAAANSFMLVLIVTILFAYAYPPLGATYLVPKVTSNWIAVIIIFFLSGIKINSEELKRALSSIGFNAFVPFYNFLVVSSIAFGISRFFVYTDVISSTVANGVVISSCMPLTLNSCTMFTIRAGGDEALAVFHATFGNLLSVVVSPALLLMYLGLQEVSIGIGTMLFNLTARILLPTIVGQIIRRSSRSVVEFQESRDKIFKYGQELCLLFIVYTLACQTFSSKQISDEILVTDLLAIFGIQLLILCLVTGLAWPMLNCFFPQDRKLHIMGVFGCTHKSIGVGIPLISSVYENHPDLEYFTLPLLVWNTLQFIVGLILVEVIIRRTSAIQQQKHSSSIKERS